jgi:hypothetical protein
MVYSRAERVFTPEIYFASISSAAVGEAFRNAYPDKQVPSKSPSIKSLARIFTAWTIRGGIIWSALLRNHWILKMSSYISYASTKQAESGN